MLLNNKKFVPLWYLGKYDGIVNGIGIYGDEKVYFHRKHNSNEWFSVDEINNYFSDNSQSILNDEGKFKTYNIDNYVLTFKLETSEGEPINLDKPRENELTIITFIKNKIINNCVNLQILVDSLEEMDIYLEPSINILYSVYKLPQSLFEILEVEHKKYIKKFGYNSNFDLDNTVLSDDRMNCQSLLGYEIECPNQYNINIKEFKLIGLLEVNDSTFK